MQKKHDLFLATFVSSLAILCFFMGASIIGYTFYSSSMHCEGGICKGFCNYDEECPANEICCATMDFGICEDVCDEPFELLEKEIMPTYASPRSSNHLILYTILTLIVIALGAMYYQHE